MTPNVFAFLMTLPAVTALIGDRVYPDKLPQHIFEEGTIDPAVVYQWLGGARQATFCATDGLVEGNLQLDIYASLYDKGKAVAEVLRLALVDFQGQMGETRVGPVSLQSDGEQPPEPEPGLHRVTHTFTVWYRE